jgi:hypothetical protein
VQLADCTAQSASHELAGQHSGSPQSRTRRRSLSGWGMAASVLAITMYSNLLQLHSRHHGTAVATKIRHCRSVAVRVALGRKLMEPLPKETLILTHGHGGYSLGRTEHMEARMRHSRHSARREWVAGWWSRYQTTAADPGALLNGTSGTFALCRATRRCSSRRRHGRSRAAELPLVCPGR